MEHVHAATLAARAIAAGQCAPPSWEASWSCKLWQSDKAGGQTLGGERHRTGSAESISAVAALQITWPADAQPQRTQQAVP